MKKAQSSKRKPARPDELSDEYQFEYSQAGPNRFAVRVDPTRVVVALDADVSQVFTKPDDVNRVLRALIATMPTSAS